MNKLKIASGLLALCVTLPIWFYLMYSALLANGASELAWFLFWVYVPVSFFVAGVGKLIDGD